MLCSKRRESSSDGDGTGLDEAVRDGFSEVSSE